MINYSHFSLGNKMIQISPYVSNYDREHSLVPGVKWGHFHYHAHKRSRHTYAVQQTEATAGATKRFC